MSRGNLHVQTRQRDPSVNMMKTRLKSLSSGRKLFEDFANRNMMDNKDWYSIAPDMLDEKTLSLVNKEFKGSIHRALSTIFPELEWCPWKFKYNRVPRDFWKETHNQRKFFDDLGKELGISSLDDWYHKLSAKLIHESRAGSVIRVHKGSPQAALKAVYPEHNWIPWKFNVVPSRFWKSIDNQRQYFDWLGNQLGITELDEWYSKLSVRVIIDTGGAGLLALYNRSPKAALVAAYPDHHWVDWKFNYTLQDNWNPQNMTQFLAELSDKLSIQTLDDWYRVDLKLLNNFGALPLVRKYKGLYGMLKQQYPHYPWDPKQFNQKGKKTQRWLVVNLKKLFPNEDIVEDYVHPKATFPSSNRPMQFDVFIPSRSLAFEYQGIQHYQDVGLFNPTRVYQQRDEEKRALCITNNIQLIEVPYWWNRTLESLRHIIAEHRIP